MRLSASDMPSTTSNWVVPKSLVVPSEMESVDGNVFNWNLFFFGGGITKYTAAKRSRNEFGSKTNLMLVLPCLLQFMSLCFFVQSLAHP